MRRIVLLRRFCTGLVAAMLLSCAAGLYAATSLPTAAPALAAGAPTVAAIDPASIKELTDILADTAKGDNGITRLSLQVATWAIAALSGLFLLVIRYMVRLAVVLEKMASRPCAASPKDIQQYLKWRETSKETNTREDKSLADELLPGPR